MPRCKRTSAKTVCENEYSPLLLVKVPVAVHIDLSSSLGLRCPPLVVLCRRGISASSSSSAFSLTVFSLVPWHLFMRDDVDEQEKECASYENRPSLAALARAALSTPQPLGMLQRTTKLHPGRTEWFHDGPRVSSLVQPARPWSTTTALRSNEVLRKRSRKTCRTHPGTDSFTPGKKCFLGREPSGGPNGRYTVHWRSCSRVTSKIQGSCPATDTCPHVHSDQLVVSNTSNVFQRRVLGKQTEHELADFGWAWIIRPSCGACDLIHGQVPCCLMRHKSCATNLIEL